MKEKSLNKEGLITWIKDKCYSGDTINKSNK